MHVRNVDWNLVGVDLAGRPDSSKSVGTRLSEHSRLGEVRRVKPKRFGEKSKAGIETPEES